jgi:hypothetical protein
VSVAVTTDPFRMIVSKLIQSSADG